MSNLVTQIVSAFETQIEAKLPTITKMDYKFDVSKNSFLAQSNRYGVVALGGESADGAIRDITVDHSFQVILTQGYKNIAKNDIAQSDAVNTLFERFDDISVQVQSTKLGIAAIVYLVSFDSVDEPEFNIDEKYVTLRGTFTVKYRTNI